MNKKLAYSLSGIGLILALGLMYFNSEELRTETNTSPEESTEPNEPAEKIQIFVFHSTNRCPSCITIGQFAKKTLDQNFSNETKSGKIEFREINIDLPENKELAKKFQAAGSSLFINSIVKEKDNIKEDVQVWRMISNEKEFIAYLSEKINKLLNKNG